MIKGKEGEGEGGVQCPIYVKLILIWRGPPPCCYGSSGNWTTGLSVDHMIVIFPTQDDDSWTYLQWFEALMTWSNSFSNSGKTNQSKMELLLKRWKYFTSAAACPLFTCRPCASWLNLAKIGRVISCEWEDACFTKCMSQRTNTLHRTE